MLFHLSARHRVGFEDEACRMRYRAETDVHSSVEYISSQSDAQAVIKDTQWTVD
jgi:hypothetical protein